MAQGNTPVIKKRNGSFSVAIFAENKQRNDGSEYLSYGAVLQKSVKDQTTGEWKTQNINLFENNILEVGTLLISAFNALIDLKNPDQPVAKAAVAAPAAQPQQLEVGDDSPF